MHDALKGLGERRYAGEVLSGKGLELLASIVCELEVYAAVIDEVVLSTGEPLGLGSSDELDGAVVAHVELVGDLSDSRPGEVRVAT